MPELWDSFYRADKAHGRQENRFGLGLSIVRSIMENHNCGYGVKNVEGGVVFTFEVSKDSDYYEKK
jgi:signal transduction histidine kinase